MEKPYVISAELDLATADFERIVRPDKIDAFRESLDADLRAMGKETLWVPSSTMSNGLEQAIKSTNVPVVSLDDRYITTADHYVGISRGVDPQLNDAGYVARRGYPSIMRQLGRVRSLGSEVIFADDVLFSGEMISWIANVLNGYGVSVRAVLVGVAIAEGIEKLEAEGVDVSCGTVFDEIEDEICERDFAVVPGSGRRIDALDANALYFDTKNGKPETWASISTELSNEFCVNSLRRSSALLQAGVSIQAIGKFLGYNYEGAAADQINRRLEEI